MARKERNEWVCARKSERERDRFSLMKGEQPNQVFHGRGTTMFDILDQREAEEGEEREEREEEREARRLERELIALCDG